jgi:hypothetical protein
MPAIPAEDHPQIIACADVCQRLGALCDESMNSGQLDRQLPNLLNQYRSDLHWGRFEKARERLEQMAALAMSAAMREYRQMGESVSSEKLTSRLRVEFKPHQNKGKLKNRTDEIGMKLKSVLGQSSVVGLRTAEDKRKIADSCLDFTLDCVKVLVRLEADEKKQTNEIVMKME